MKIVIIGYMGSGKSSVGKALAASIGYNFFDLDSQIEFIEEKSISKIFYEKGEIYFRKRENLILKELMTSETNVVLAAGGGTPCYGDSMDFLLRQEETITIYLKASLSFLTDRLFQEKLNRPLIAHIDTKEILMDFIRKHLFERSYYYNQASLKIDVENVSVAELVKKITVALF
jgi:shikimate kinase